MGALAVVYAAEDLVRQVDADLPSILVSLQGWFRSFRDNRHLRSEEWFWNRHLSPLLGQRWAARRLEELWMSFSVSQEEVDAENGDNAER